MRWLSPFLLEAMCLLEPIAVPAAGTRSGWPRGRAFRLARRVETESGRPFGAATASKTRIPAVSYLFCRGRAASPARVVSAASGAVMNKPQPVASGSADRPGVRGEPGKPVELGVRGWWGVLRRTVREFGDDNLPDWAAALTYYGVLSIFPALIALVSILGLVGSSATQPLLDNLGSFAPGPAKEIFANAIRGLEESQGAAGLLFVVGLAGALWAASGYIGAFIRAANVIWDVPEGRPIWKTVPLRLAITVVTVLLLAVSAVAVVVTGPLADKVGRLIGVGGLAVTIWDVAKWPVLVVIVSFLFAILYYAAPNVRQPGFRWITPGGVLAILLWMIASAAFALYVAKFGSYNKTYGALGGAVIFLVWLWLSNLAMLLGAELNAELARGRQIKTGHPPEKEPFLPPRDEP
jgi:membrane protein